MIYYFILILATILITIFTVFAWKKSKSLSVIVGIGFLYYWTLYGAWIIVSDQLSNIHYQNESKFHYYYLFDKLFEISLDSIYLKTLIIYSFFILVIICSFMLFCKKNNVNTCNDRIIYISPIILILISIISMLFSYFILDEVFKVAYNTGSSIYNTSRNLAREGEIEYFTISQILNRIAVISIATSIAIYLSSKNPFYFRMKATSLISKFSLLIIGLIAILQYYSLAMLGNKNELFFGLIFGVLLYMLNNRKPNFTALSLLGLLTLTAILAVNGIRSLSSSKLSDLKAVLSSMANATSGFYSSNEAFGAHFSMYGALFFDIKWTYGSSLISLLYSMIPRSLFPNRPETIYTHYVDSVYAAYGQGYTIHHATGWYLNFGLVGVLLGGVLFGCIWGYFTNNSIYYKTRSQFLAILSVVSSAGIVAGIPAFIRTGPEGYKALIVESILIPTIIIFASIHRRFIIK